MSRQLFPLLFADIKAYLKDKIGTLSGGSIELTLDNDVGNLIFLQMYCDVRQAVDLMSMPDSTATTSASQSTNILHGLLCATPQIVMNELLSWSYEYKGASRLAYAQLALNNGADVNMRDGDFVMLQQCVVDNDINFARLLIDQGADVDAISMIVDRTPLMLASRNGNTELVELLLRHGANVGLVTADGKSAASFAYEAGNSYIHNRLNEMRGTRL
jgi:hypothetical protein